MRYACDGLNAFGLHDARVREAALEGRDLLWTLEDGNALPQWPANPHGYAMRVPKLSLRLREYKVQRLLVWSLERRGPESGILQHLPQDLPPEAGRAAWPERSPFRRGARGRGRSVGGTRLLHRGRRPLFGGDARLFQCTAGMGDVFRAGVVRGAPRARRAMTKTTGGRALQRG